MPARACRAPGLPLSLACLAFALRVSGLTAQSLWRDEVDSLRFATQALPALLEMFRKPGENGPLFFLALRPWLRAAGTSEFALRFPSAAAGALSVTITYVLLHRLIRDRLVAGVASLLMATAPYAVWYGQEAKMYAALTVLVPLSLYLAVRASWHGGWWRWVLLYVVTSLGFYTHLLVVLVVPVQAIWLAILPSLAPDREPERSRRRRAKGLLYVVLLLLPYLPLAQWQAPQWLAGAGQTGYPFVPLPTILLILLVAFSRGILPVTQPAVLAPAVLAFLSGVVLWPMLPDSVSALLRRERRGIVGLLLAWLLLPPLGIYIISLRRPLFVDRYLIWSMPALLALTALGLLGLRRIGRPLGLAILGTLVALNLITVWTQTAQPIKSDFRAAARFVAAHEQAGDLLVFQIPYNRYTFAYYSGEPDRWLDGPYTNSGMDEAVVDAELARGIASSPAAWLIASEVAMWDTRDLTAKWLNTHGIITDHEEFASVSVTRYALR